MNYSHLTTEEQQQLRAAALRQIEELHYASKIAWMRAQAIDDHADAERHHSELDGLEAQHDAILALNETEDEDGG